MWNATFNVREMGILYIIWCEKWVFCTLYALCKCHMYYSSVICLDRHECGMQRLMCERLGISYTICLDSQIGSVLQMCMCSLFCYLYPLI